MQSPSPSPSEQSTEPLDALVPGSYPQVEEDLRAFGPSVLKLLARSGVKVAVLSEGQNLADSPGLPTVSQTQYGLQRRQARELLAESIEQPPAGLSDLQGFAESATRSLREQNLDFHLGLAYEPFGLGDIAERRQIPEEHRQAWEAAFLDLNRDLVTAGEDSRWKADFGLVLLPYTYHNGEVIPENKLRNAKETTAEYVEGSLGLHRSEERLVLLHEKFVAAPATEIGNYRLALHEMGHALDHVLDALVGVPGFGPLHRQTVDALYERDLAAADCASVEEVFTTDRASDNVREYFAEAVEAYLTLPNDNGHDHFRAGNSRPGLLAKNPELHDYVAGILSTDFPKDAEIEAPKRSLLPDWVPDPDMEVIRVA